MATGLSVITDAFALLTVFAPGETIPNVDAQLGLRLLNNMLGQLAQQKGAVPVNARLTFPLVANQASYTIGPGGNFNTARPANAGSLTDAAIYLTAQTPWPGEIPIAVFTDDGFTGIPFKTMTAAFPTGVYLDTSYTGGLASIDVWPVPNTATYTLVLYVDQAISAFADLTTTYTFPQGWDEMLTYNLARRLATPYRIALDPSAAQIAANSLRIIKRSNLRMNDMANDFAGDGGVYDIRLGNG